MDDATSAIAGGTGGNTGGSVLDSGTGGTNGGNVGGTGTSAGSDGGDGSTASNNNGGTSGNTAGDAGNNNGGNGGTDAGTSGNNGGNNGGSGGSKPTQGEVLITEVMFNPSTTEPDTEWFEVYNAASTSRDLGGLVISDGSSNTHTIAGSVVVQPGAYAVLINSLAQGSPTVPQSSVVYAYSGLTFANSNSASNVKLASSGTTIAQAPYGGFPSTLKVAGDSIQLQVLTFADESSSGSWCKSTLTWSGSADKGTPGAATKCQ